MPHIHTQPGQHDMTVSAYIVRRFGGRWKCLVHMHKKAGKLMQVGGHMELAETPWQTIAHEAQEESGYGLGELDVLQMLAPPQLDAAVIHPTPFALNTHAVGEAHFHTDLCYGFVAVGEPTGQTVKGESSDLRWCEIAELQNLAEQEECLRDVAQMYQFLLENLGRFERVPAMSFSQKKACKR